MSKIWIIDDEICLLDMIKLYFELTNFDDKRVEYVTSFEACTATPGDVVLHDLGGVGEGVKFDNVTYYSHSGDFESADFPKPYPIDEIINKLIEELSCPVAA